MNSTEVAGYLAQVESMFNFDYKPGARKSLSISLELEPIDGATSSIKVLESKWSKLPSPVELLRVIRECAAFIREGDSRQRKEERKEIYKPPNDEYVKRSMMLINGINSGKMTRRQIVEAFKIMDGVYPDRGWAVQGSILMRKYESKNLKIDSTPSMSISAII